MFCLLCIAVIPGLLMMSLIPYYTLILSVGWRIQTNIAPVSGRALASSDTSGVNLYTSPYWLYKCFIIPILRIYIISQISSHFTKAKTLPGQAIHNGMWSLRETIIVTLRHNNRTIHASQSETHCLYWPYIVGYTVSRYVINPLMFIVVYRQYN